MNEFKEVIRKNRWMIAAYLASGIVLAFLKNFSAGYFQTLIDRFTGGTLTLWIISVYGSVLLALCVFYYLAEYPGRRLEHGIYLDLKLRALRKISGIDYLVYRTMGTGKLVQRIENGAAAGKGILFSFAFRLFRELLPEAVFSMVFIYQLSQKVMLAILAGYIVVFAITNLLLKALYRIKERILTNEENLNHFLVRGFMEMVVFRLYKRFDQEIRKAAEAREEIVASKVKMTMIHEAFFALFAVLITLIKIAIILYGWRTGSLSIGAVIALVFLVDNAYTPVAIFNVLFVQYKLDRTAYRRYSEFLNSKDDVQLAQGEIVKSLSGSIRFDRVGFHYENRKIFEHFSLAISAGETVALVGESGSGKSTLARLLTGLLKPGEGAIHVGGYDLAKVNLDSYYDHLAYIPQESPIFDGTLRENLVFDSVADDRQILEVLEKVCLSELYSKLEKGLDTELGEKGFMLSGGERQRLSLARLWFSSPSIVILDEATSAMDNLTEESVMAQVMERLAGKTVLVIAHRLSTIKNFSRIIAFRNGEIVGQGDFEGLLETSPYFKDLYYASEKESRTGDG